MIAQPRARLVCQKKAALDVVVIGVTTRRETRDFDEASRWNRT
jgi:hypothetical protein